MDLWRGADSWRYAPLLCMLLMMKEQAKFVFSGPILLGATHPLNFFSECIYLHPFAPRQSRRDGTAVRFSLCVVDYPSVSKNVWSFGYQRGRLICIINVRNKRSRVTVHCCRSLCIACLSTTRKPHYSQHCGIYTPITYNVRLPICRVHTHKYKKAELSQRWPRDAPYIWVPWKFSRVPEYAHGYISRNF